MCGIAGWVDFDRDALRDVPTLEAMTETLTARGPDASGFWTGREAALGHRRLVVIDPVGGAQPMERTIHGRTAVIVYNGELYNMEDLGAELERAGYLPRTRSDTELVLLACLAWGERALEHLDGIFAFAVWDVDRRRLLMGRDRLGVKPLFYWQRGRKLVFASEMKAILAHPEVDPVVEADGLAEVLAMGPARTPGHGIFRRMHELRAGHLLTFGPDGARTRPYWGLVSAPHEESAAETASHLEALFVSAVRRQMVSDVPLGTFLSGGLDSSAVSAVAARHAEETGRAPLPTFSVDFRGQSEHFRPTDFQTNLDAPWVDVMVRHLGTSHHRVELDTDGLVEALLPSLRGRDMPGMADVDTSLFLFCREIRKECTVALSGEAADEIFGGYPWCHRPDGLSASTFPWNLRLADRLALLAPSVRQWIRGEEYVAERYDEALSEVPRLPGETGAAQHIREILYLNISRFLANLLERKDRMSMMTSLEVRVPFCDHRLVEYVWNIPWEMKNTGGQAKGILREALGGWLPEGVRTRRKSPYPSTANPSYGQAMRRWLKEVMADPTSPLHGVVDEAAVERLSSLEGAMADLPWFGQLMGVPQMYAFLIQLDAWLRQYRVRLA